MKERIDPTKLDLKEKTISIGRVTKVVKGGKRFSFNAIVAVGDGSGHVGIGLGKANDVPSAIKKGIEHAKKSLIRVPLNGATISHDVESTFGATTVILKPASGGTGVVAGATVRSILELAGIKDVLTKAIGPTNPHNVVKATMKAMRFLAETKDISESRLPLKQEGEK